MNQKKSPNKNMEKIIRKNFTNNTVHRHINLFFSFFALLVFIVPLPAQKPAGDAGNYVPTTIGNSLPMGDAVHPDHDYRSHVMLNCFGIEVSPDGRVYAGGHNETGHAVSVYKDGDLESDKIPQAKSGDGCWNWGTANRGAVSFDDDYMYAVSECGKVHKWERTPPYHEVSVMNDIGTPAEEIVVRYNKLYLLGSGNKAGELQIRNLDADFSLIKSFTVPGAYDIAVSGEHSIWVSLGGENGAKDEVRRYDAEGNQLSGTLDGFGKLMGISIGNAEGKLIVCDDGPDKQIFFYDISNPSSPSLTKKFGEKGGIYSGSRGVLDHDLQFYDVQDAGTDSAGNIYTLFSVSPLESNWNGNMVRKYTPGGNKVWELSAHFGCAAASVLPSSDGEEIYGVEEVFKRDYSVSRDDTTAQQWKIHAISKDDITDSAGLRENRKDYGQFIGSAEARTIDGKRVVFRHDMYGRNLAGKKGYDLYVFEDRPSMVSHHRGYISGSGAAWYPDRDGNVWEGNSGDGTIRMHQFSGFDATGAPKYNTFAPYEPPAFFSLVTRIYYDRDNDVLYLSGYTPRSDTLPVNLAGTHLRRYDDWKAGNRTAKYTTELPWDRSGRPLPPKTMYVAGDYIFTVAVRPDEAEQKVTVFNAATGDKVGTMSAGDIYGYLGWVDITTGLTAFRRSNGEYIVIVEENGLSKNMVYRWCPSGDCSETLETELRSPASDTGFVNPGTFTIQANVSGEGSLTIDKVAFYVNDSMIGEDAYSPYSYTWNIPGRGTYELYAKAITSSGGYKTSPAITADVTDGSPSGKITKPLYGQSYTVLDTILLEAQATDYGGSVDTVNYYHGDTLIGSATAAPYHCIWRYPEAGNYHLRAKLIDNENNVSTTPIIPVSVSGEINIPFITPQNGESFDTGSDVSLQLDLSMFDTVSSVTYYNEDTVLGQVKTAPFAYIMKNSTSGLYHLSASVQYAGGREITARNKVDFSVSRKDPLVIMAVNCGELESSFISQDSIVYMPDTMYCTSGCNDKRISKNTGKEISGTVDDFIYQSNRFSNVGTTDFSYTKAVEDGGYEVTLKFAEIYSPAGSTGFRVFDVRVEGVLMIADLDVYDRVGMNTALDITDTVVVSDGKLNITIIDNVTNAIVSGILVKKLPGDYRAPEAPANVRAAKAADSVLLNWQENQEADLAGYHIYRSATSGSGYSKINTSLCQTSGYTDHFIAPSQSYYYVVTAVDTAGNESGYSSEVSATSATAIPEIYSGKPGLRLYPNPLQELQLTVELTGMTGPVTLIVYTIGGIKVYKTILTGNTTHLSASTFPDRGIYILSVIGTSHIVRRKLIIE